MAHLAWVTCTNLPDGAPDEQAVLACLREAGHRVTPWIWEQPIPEGLDLAVVRSPWDYHLKRRAWVDWLGRLTLPICNPPLILAWNTDKSYLLELAARGVRILPTVLAPRGRPFQLAECVREHSWEHAVVKPAISASAHGTWLARGQVGEEARFQAQLEDEDLLIQPYFEEVVEQGEWSLIFLDRVFSHAVLKRPAGGDFRSQEEHGGRIEPASPPAELQREASCILERVPGFLLYARVDGVVRDGRFYLMELELLDPHLFLGHAPGASQRFAQAVEKCLQSV